MKIFKSNYVVLFFPGVLAKTYNDFEKSTEIPLSSMKKIPDKVFLHVFNS